MADADLAELQERIALLEARLAAQQTLLETETRRRIALEEALAAWTRERDT
ncbi:MAG: hypothetical protein AAFU86_00005 [Pseudomonadota bacterium]